MKTREELAREWVHERLFNPPADVDLVKWTIIDVEAAYRDGFDAGFARAIELLRDGSPGKDRWGWQWADWLEKQQKEGV